MIDERFGVAAIEIDDFAQENGVIAALILELLAASRNTGRLSERSDRLHRTIGGSRLTELKLFAVSP